MVSREPCENVNAVVTGGAGFIGSHLVNRLVELGHQVTVIDDESAEYANTLPRNHQAAYHKIDICDYEGILPLFERAKFVFHLAAESRIQPTLLRPQRACQVNLVGTCNVLQASRACGVGKVMYSSTSSAYGLKNTPPLKEDAKNDCLNPYSVSKAAAEDLCRMYYILFGLGTVTFRYFNVYGEGQCLSGQYAPVIGAFLRQKSAGEDMSIVGDGLQRRDFTHVSNVIAANLLAAFSEDESILGETFNIGMGESHSILEVCEMIGGRRRFIPARLGEARNSTADISKAKSLLGYAPAMRLQDWINKNNVKAPYVS